MVISESSREMSTGTSEARCLAVAGSEPIAYRVASYSTDSEPSTPSTRTWPAAFVSRTCGFGPAESMESFATLVPEMLSPRDLQSRSAATASSTRIRTASNRSSGDVREDCPRSRGGNSSRRGSSSSLKSNGKLHRYGATRPYTSSSLTMSSSSNSPKEISSILTSLSPGPASLWTVPRGIKTFSPTSGSRTSSPSCILTPSSSTTHSSSRWWWYWLESLPPGATVMILTVQGRLCVYCSKLPQGLSTFMEGGR